MSSGPDRRGGVNREVGANRVTRISLDLSSFDSIRRVAQELKDRPVDVLINNAGVMGGDFGGRMKALNGVSVSISWGLPSVAFAANNLADGRNPRLVQLSSGAHRFAAFNFEDHNFDTEPYNGDIAYQRSKTACALFAVGFQTHYARLGIDAFFSGARYRQDRPSERDA